MKPVADGLSLPELGASGNEDSRIEILADLTNLITLKGVPAKDPSEVLTTILIDGVPDGFLIRQGDAGTNLAQNAGDNGKGMQFKLNGVMVGLNTWSIDISSGVPKVWIEAPANWSGNLSLDLVAFVSEGGDIQQKVETFNVEVKPVADTLSLAPTKTFGDEGDDIAINLNANVRDLDGSETATLTLSGIKAGASFKVNGSGINDANINYDSGQDIYTISGIGVNDINNLSFVQQAVTGNVDVTVQMVETNNLGAPSVAVNGSFNLDIAAVGATTGNNTLFYKPGKDIDGLTGEDTLMLSKDAGINFSGLADNIKNMEIVDLSANGNHAIANLSLANVLSLTDNDNDIKFLGDDRDSVSFANSDGWVKNPGTVTDAGKVFEVYTNTGDPSVEVKVEENIVDSIV